MSFQIFSKISFRSFGDRRCEGVPSAAEAAPASDRTARERSLLADGKLFWRLADCWADAAVANPRETKLHARRMALREMRLLLGSVGRVISRVFRANGIIGTQTRLRILKLPAVEACG